MALKHIFATVGTTKFDPLVHNLLRPESLQVLRSRGYGSLNIQIGAGAVDPFSGLKEGIYISCFRFLPSIAEEIECADLIISHAGAGTCLEVLNAHKPLIAVVNCELMGDHQMELAERLAENGHIIFCKRPEEIPIVLDRADFSGLIPFPPGKPEKFANFLDDLMGFKSSE